MARFELYFLLTGSFAFCSGFIIHDQNQASIGPGPGGLPLLVDTSEIMVRFIFFSFSVFTLSFL